MCCATQSHHQGCCCSDVPNSYTPRFMTKGQRIARFENYLETLKEEARAVEEHIKEMKKEK